MINKTVNKIAFAAMLIVFNIFLTAVPRYFEIGAIFAFNRITLGPATTIFSSLILGPLFGGIVGGCSDILSWVIFPNSGAPLNIFITMIYILLGIIPFYIYKVIKYWGFAGTFSLLVSLLVLLLISIYIMFFTDGIDEKMLTSEVKIVFLILSIFIISGTLIISYKFKKFMSEDFNVICLVCFFCEIFLMVALKPFAFNVYCNVFYGVSLKEHFGISYKMLVLIGLLFGCINIPLNSLSVSYIKRLFNKINLDHK